MEENYQQGCNLESLLSRLVDYSLLNAKQLNASNIVIQDIFLDTRAVDVPRALPFAFVSIAEKTADCIKHIQTAISFGAKVIFTNKNNNQLKEVALKHSIPIVFVADLNNKLDILAKAVYKYALECNVIAVTGTNGKTSICYQLFYLYNAVSIKTAYIGTLGIGSQDHWYKSELTTPDIFSTYRAVEALYLQGNSIIVLEASSHALEQGRIKGLNITTAIFTNLSHDHLDYHKDMQNYFSAKLKLFKYPTLKQVFINLDCDYGRKAYKYVSEHWLNMLNLTHAEETKVYSYSTLFSYADFYAEDIKSLEKSYGYEFKLKISSNKHICKTSLPAMFNVSNILSVLSVISKVSPDKLFLAVEKLALLPCVPGRMQSFKLHNNASAIIDFAHTPDALSKALQACKDLLPKRLICVFGCGGDRDRSKRSVMGEVSAKMADIVIVTDDNPRTEDPASIVEDIVSTLTEQELSKFIFKRDRADAIRFAIELANSEDIILIAGKGHEDYQIVGSKKRYYSDHDEVKKLIFEEQINDNS